MLMASLDRAEALRASLAHGAFCERDCRAQLRSPPTPAHMREGP